MPDAGTSWPASAQQTRNQVTQSASLQRGSGVASISPVGPAWPAITGMSSNWIETAVSSPPSS